MWRDNSSISRGLDVRPWSFISLVFVIPESHHLFRNRRSLTLQGGEGGGQGPLHAYVDRESGARLGREIVPVKKKHLQACEGVKEKRGSRS